MNLYQKESNVCRLENKKEKKEDRLFFRRNGFLIQSLKIGFVMMLRTTGCGAITVALASLVGCGLNKERKTSGNNNDFLQKSTN